MEIFTSNRHDRLDSLGGWGAVLGGAKEAGITKGTGKQGNRETALLIMIPLYGLYGGNESPIHCFINDGCLRFIVSLRDPGRSLGSTASAYVVLWSFE